MRWSDGAQSAKTVAMLARDLSQYRSNVGIALFNPAGQVFVGKRCGERSRFAWQMPQGGIDEGEDAHAAALRELQEETGVPPHCVSLLATLDDWLIYDFPPAVLAAKKRRGQDWIGQKQRWFALAFHGEVCDIDLAADDTPEFDEWRWAALEETPDLVIPWKRHIYDAVLEAFAPVAARLAQRP